MRRRNTLNTLYGTFCFAIFANQTSLDAQVHSTDWIQFKNQPKELVNFISHSSSSKLDAGVFTEKLVTGTDLNLFNFNLLYHKKHSYGVNLVHFGSPDYQTSQGNLGYLWHNPKFDVTVSTQFQKSTFTAWKLTPAASITYNNTHNSKFSAFYKLNESLGIGYHLTLKKGGMINLHYAVPSFKTSENTQQFSCSFYYPALDKIWVGIESHPIRRFNQLTLLYKVSSQMNVALQTGYFTSFQTFNLRFYAGCNLP